MHSHIQDCDPGRRPKDPAARATMRADLNAQRAGQRPGRRGAAWPGPAGTTRYSPRAPVWSRDIRVTRLFSKLGRLFRCPANSLFVSYEDLIHNADNAQPSGGYRRWRGSSGRAFPADSLFLAKKRPVRARLPALPRSHARLGGTTLGVRLGLPARVLSPSPLALRERIKRGHASGFVVSRRAAVKRGHQALNSITRSVEILVRPVSGAGRCRGDLPSLFGQNEDRAAVDETDSNSAFSSPNMDPASAVTSSPW